MLGMTKAPGNSLTELEREILDISIHDYDVQAAKRRDLLVRQRFVLGLVEMFEKIPELEFVLFCPEENVASMIKPPPAENYESRAEWRAMTSRVQKSLQKARAAISPQSRDTKHALTWFFNNGPLFDSQSIRVDRSVFSRSNLPRLCDPQLERLDSSAVSELKREQLQRVADRSRDVPRPGSGRSLKM